MGCAQERLPEKVKVHKKNSTIPKFPTVAKQFTRKDAIARRKNSHVVKNA